MEMYSRTSRGRERVVQVGCSLVLALCFLVVCSDGICTCALFPPIIESQK